MEIRSFHPEDYDRVYELWKACNLSLGASDTKEEVLKFISMNEETSLIGVMDGEIIGSVLGGYDGRRGLVHHLSVHPKHQGKGYGSMLMEYLENKFREKGVVKLSFWVLNSNIGVVDFYEKIGYELRKDIVTLSKIL